MIDYAAALEKIRSIKQEALLEGWNSFSQEQKENLLQQIQSLDIPLLLKQQALIHETPRFDESAFAPPDHVSKKGDEKASALGREAIKQGLVGSLIIAGGQGTRLGFPHPKGMFPITKIKHKSLFQLFLEKAIASGKRAGRDLPVAIMTSKENDQETKDFLKKHDFFGARSVGFFSQGNLPLFTKEGNLFLKERQIATAPDGNGSSINCFAKSPLFDAWKKMGVRYVLFTLIDNPLADPFDEELIGKMIQSKSDVVIKAIERKDPEEKVGVLVKRHVIEYTEFPKSKSEARTEEGTLLFNLANISLFAFSMDFIEKVKTTYYKKMPLHKAFKRNAWKFERFIFDLLPFANHVETVVYPRNECFSPLKNAEGEASPASVQKALVENDQRVLKNLLGTPPPTGIEEIAQDYYYPTGDLLKRLPSLLNVQNPYLDS